MIKTLTKHGNSYALVIDKPILEILNIEPDTPLEITTNRDRLVISPVRSKEKQAKLNGVLRDINKDFGSDLKKLSE